MRHTVHPVCLIAADLQDIFQGDMPIGSVEAYQYLQDVLERCLILGRRVEHCSPSALSHIAADLRIIANILRRQRWYGYVDILEGIVENAVTRQVILH